MSVVTWARPNVAVTRSSGTIQMASHNDAVLSVWASGTAARAAEWARRLRNAASQPRRGRDNEREGHGEEKNGHKGRRGDHDIVRTTQRAPCHFDQRLDDDDEHRRLDADKGRLDQGDFAEKGISDAEGDDDEGTGQHE